MTIALVRHYVLHNHYTEELCCYCYQQALQYPQQIFEWQTCEYDYNIKDPNDKCGINTPQNPQNLSTNYNLFSADWYHLLTASVVSGIVIIYAIFTYLFIMTHNTNSVDPLLNKLPLEFMLYYNVSISTVIFYQIAVNYQFFADPKLNAPIYSVLK